MSAEHFSVNSILLRLRRRSEQPAGTMLTIVNVSRRIQLATRVQLAADAGSRRKGLLGRERLAEGEGLWIVPCEAVHTFWMQFPIDLIYLDRQSRVLKTRSSVPAWRLSACLRAHSVIELAAGVVRETNTRPGDQLSLDRATNITGVPPLANPGVAQPSGQSLEVCT